MRFLLFVSLLFVLPSAVRADEADEVCQKCILSGCPDRKHVEIYMKNQLVTRGLEPRAMVVFFHGDPGGEVFDDNMRPVALPDLARAIKARAAPGQPLQLTMCNAAERNPVSTSPKSTMVKLGELLPGHLVLAAVGKVNCSATTGLTPGTGWAFLYVDPKPGLNGQTIFHYGTLTQAQVDAITYRPVGTANEPIRLSPTLIIDAENRVVVSSEPLPPPRARPGGNNPFAPPFGPADLTLGKNGTKNTPGCLANFNSGRISRRYGWLAKGVFSTGLKAFGKSLGSNGSAGVGFVGGKMCAFGLQMAQQRYNETAFLMDEFIFALTGGAYEARFKSNFPDDKFRCSAEGIQIRPYCDGQDKEAGWKWANAEGVTLVQPVDLQNKFKRIIDQTLPGFEVVAGLQERLADIESELYVLSNQSGDTTARREALEREREELGNSIVVYKERVSVMAQDPEDPTKTINSWIWEVGWNVPAGPYTLEDGTAIDPRKIDVNALSEKEKLFFRGLEKGRVQISNELLEKLWIAKYPCGVGNCKARRLEIDHIRAIWTEIFLRQEKEKKEKQIQQISFECESAFGRFQATWNNLLRNASCPADREKDREEVRASTSSLERHYKDFINTCPIEQIARLVKDNATLFSEYRRHAQESEKLSCDYRRGMEEAVYSQCKRNLACSTRVNHIKGFTTQVGENGEMVLQKNPNSPYYAFALQAEVDGRFFKVGSSPSLQTQCQNEAGEPIFISGAAGRNARCEDAFAERDIHGNVWSLPVIVDINNVCGKVMTFDFDIKTYNRKAACKPIEVRFDCTPPERLPACGCVSPRPPNVIPLFPGLMPPTTTLPVVPPALPPTTSPPPGVVPPTVGTTTVPPVYGPPLPPVLVNANTGGTITTTSTVPANTTTYTTTNTTTSTVNTSNTTTSTVYTTNPTTTIPTNTGTTTTTTVIYGPGYVPGVRIPYGPTILLPVDPINLGYTPPTTGTPTQTPTPSVSTGTATPTPGVSTTPTSTDESTAGMTGSWGIFGF